MIELGANLAIGDIFMLVLWLLIFIAPIFLILIYADAMNPRTMTFYVCSGLVIGLLLCVFSVSAGVLGFLLMMMLGMILRRLQRIEAKIEAKIEEKKEAEI